MVFDRLVGWDRVAQLLPPSVMTMLDNRYVNIAGDTITGAITFANTILASGVSTFANAVNVTGGDLTVDRNASAANVNIQADAGVESRLRLRTDASDRWVFRKADTESGGNAGSNLYVDRYADNGSFLGVLFSAVRSTGILTFSNSPLAPTPTLGDSSTKLATTAFVTNTALGAGISRTLLTGTGDQYLGAKGFAAAELTTTSHYRITLGLTKTASAVNTTINFRLGPNFSTADQSILAIPALTGTAATDFIHLVVDLQVDTINSSTGTVTTFAAVNRLNNGTTGFNNAAIATQFGGAQTGSLNTSGAGWIGASVNVNTGSVVTVAYFNIQKVVN